jgi:hypothetical protein
VTAAIYSELYNLRIEQAKLFIQLLLMLSNLQLSEDGIMKKALIFILLFSIIIGCKDSKSPPIVENEVSKLRIVNLIDYLLSVSVRGNGQILCDTLRCNGSSGYINIEDDSLNIDVLGINLNSYRIIDTLVTLQKNIYYTLFLFKQNQKVYLLLTEDQIVQSNEFSKIRIFNNSSMGEPFIVYFRSKIDSITFVDPILHQASSYKSIFDTLYTPSIKIIPLDISGDFKKVSLQKMSSYTLIVTDNWPEVDYRYPYISFIIEDVDDIGDSYIYLE